RLRLTGATISSLRVAAPVRPRGLTMQPSNTSQTVRCYGQGVTTTMDWTMPPRELSSKEHGQSSMEAASHPQRCMMVHRSNTVHLVRNLVFTGVHSRLG